MMTLVPNGPTSKCRCRHNEKTETPRNDGRGVINNRRGKGYPWLTYDSVRLLGDEMIESDGGYRTVRGT